MPSQPQDPPTRSVRPWVVLLVLAALVAVVVAVVRVPSPPAPPPESPPPPEPPPSPSSYVLFESDPVRPLAISPDGRHLAVTNIPGGAVEFFRLDATGPVSIGRVPVGVEPVALAWRGPAQVWVVNHVSDSVSVVDFDGRVGSPGQVSRTLLVGDEPRDIVFARGRAFVTTARRGQNAPDPQSTTAGLGRADVWVFDPEGSSFTRGERVAKITLFTDVPRALAVSADESTVYAAGFRTGNRTTIVHWENVLAAGEPDVIVDGKPQLPAGRIVQYDGAAWRDDRGTDWSEQVALSLPDLDVFALDATAQTPTVKRQWSGVGTVLFGMAVDPATGQVFVSNTEANNLTRFEGDGRHGTTVRGELHRAQISILGDETLPRVRHLNKHIDYRTCCEKRPNPTNAASLATPMTPAFSADGATVYVPGFGSSAIGVYAAAALRDDTFTPDPAAQIAVTGGGPAGIVLDEGRRRAYVLTRFDNAVAVIDLDRRAEVGKVALPDPEPEWVRAGRPFLYDARHTSSNGEASCASCHVFGDLDHLAWDLGDPGGTEQCNPNPCVSVPVDPGFPLTREFQALKGPMTTQSLRGMHNHGPMHWRGDRTGATCEGAGSGVLCEPRGAHAQPDTGAFDERAAFMAFNGAFVGLVGRDAPLSEAEMSAFAAFALALSYPPNPIRRLDNQDTCLEERGRQLYHGRVTDTFGNCNFCHTLNPDGNAMYGIERPGFFGTSGMTTFAGIPQMMKVPHLRNVYQKVGMFGVKLTQLVPPADDVSPTGDQVRGFGFAHDGSIDTLLRFFSISQFAHRPPGALAPTDPGNRGGFTPDLEGLLDRESLAAFVLAFPSNFAPIVGQQVTVTGAGDDAVDKRVGLLRARAQVGECDLVVHDRVDGVHRGGLYGDAAFRYDDGTVRPVAEALARVPATLTCVPPGEGRRYAFHRL